MLICVVMLFSCAATDQPSPNGTDDTTASNPAETGPAVDGSLVAVTTANNEATLADLSFFFNGIYSSDKAQYGSYLSMLGLDTSKSLKEQAYGTGTWFDYYLNAGLLQMKSNLLFAEYAKANGIEMSPEEEEEERKYMEDVRALVDSQGITMDAFLKNYYGSLVDETVFEKCHALQVIALKAYGEYTASLNYTDEMYEEGYAKYRGEIDCIDYYRYTVASNVPEDATEEEVAAIKSALKEDLEKLSGAGSLEEFEKAFAEEIKKRYTGDDELTEEKIRSEMSSYLMEGSDLSNLVNLGFSEGEEIVAGKSAITENYNQYTLVYVVSDPKRDESDTVSMRYILLTPAVYQTEEEANQKAEEIIAEYSSGEKTGESFGKLAKQYSEDTYTRDSGGLTENLRKTDVTDAEVVEWLFDDTRKEGDTAVLQCSSGLLIARFEGESGPAWKNSLKSIMQADDYLAELDRLAEEFEYTENADVIAQFYA